MDRFFGSAYRGDPGVPHADQDRFSNIWIGSFAFNVITWFHPYTWHIITPRLNWHDRAMLFEQYHWKEAMKRGERYKFKWNEMDKEIRDSYYLNWPDLFK